MAGQDLKNHTQSVRTPKPGTDEVLPQIHMMAGGLYALPYARFAAECLWRKCPDSLRGHLSINIGMFAVPPPLVAQAEAFLREVPCVSVLLNPVQVPLRIFNLPQGYTRHRIGVILRGLRHLSDWLGLPPKFQIRLIPVLHGHFASYLQEYLIRICDLCRDRPSICMVDADFFVWDESFFQKLGAELSERDFAAAWLQRYDDGAIMRGETFFPPGSECLRLKPALFNQWNRQVETIDRSMQLRLQRRYPGLGFQRDMVDTAYQASWESQWAGMQITYPFRGIKACHIGGFGHAHPGYIQKCLDAGTPEGEEEARFWIQRIRLNERVARVLAARYRNGLVEPALEQILHRTSGLRQNEIIRARVEKTPPSGDELLFEEILAGLAEPAELPAGTVPTG